SFQKISSCSSWNGCSGRLSLLSPAFCSAGALFEALMPEVPVREGTFIFGICFHCTDAEGVIPASGAGAGAAPVGAAVSVGAAGRGPGAGGAFSELLFWGGRGSCGLEFGFRRSSGGVGPLGGVGGVTRFFSGPSSATGGVSLGAAPAWIAE